MDARPLRELLADLVGDAEARHAYGSDPAGYLAANGHPDLPEPLVTEAVVSYADTAPVEVAETLAPYVTAHGPISASESASESSEPAPDWFDLLTTAPVGDDPFGEHPDAAPSPDDWADPAELDFGAGADSVEEAVEEPVEEPVEQAPVVETGAVEEGAAPEWAGDAPFTPFAQEPSIDGLEPEEDEPID